MTNRWNGLLALLVLGMSPNLAHTSEAIEKTQGLCLGTIRGCTASPCRILFVGNSLTYYNGGLERHFQRLAASATPSVNIEVFAQTDPDQTLRGHYWNKKTVRQIRSGKWDIVILQGYSNEPLTNRDEFVKYARLLEAEAQKVKAQVVLFMTWAYKDSPAMSGLLRNAYVRLGQVLESPVVPVGMAWQRVIDERPDIRLYQHDVKHPSFSGTYLAACLFYATLLGETPVGLPYIGNLSVDESIYLQRIAWETSQLFSP